MAKLVLEKLIGIDNTGMPCKPDIRQLQDKDVLTLYTRDRSVDKEMYLKEIGVVYYLGDPKSPAKQQGLSDSESLKMAIENYNLPKTYLPDEIVKRLIDKYYVQNITPAGVALEALQKSVHLCAIAANRINDLLNKKLSGAISDDDITQILELMDKTNKQIQNIPSQTKAIGTAYDNLRDEQEEQLARGGVTVSSSMLIDG